MCPLAKEFTLSYTGKKKTNQFNFYTTVIKKLKRKKGLFTLLLLGTLLQTNTTE